VPSGISTPAEAARASAEALAERLYAEHRPRLLAIARRNSSNRDDAEEALQDAFILFIDHFDPAGEAPPLPWLTLTLKRRCWALYGQRRRRARPVGPLRLERAAAGPGRPPQELCEVAEQAARLRRDLAALKPDQRRALALLALGYTYAEIGEICDWSWTKVNRCLAEGRATLRGLAEDGEGTIPLPAS
jgi:RNA polymerase sigma factor (sigma-70 family)